MAGVQVTVTFPAIEWLVPNCAAQW